MGNLTRISGSLIANYSSSITQTGSFGSLAVSDKVQGTLTLNSNLTGSLTSTGSFGSLNATHLNGILEGTLGPVANALISGSTVVNAPNISGSITSTGSFGSLVVVDKVQGNLTLGGNLLASGDLDIGSHGFRAATLTADGLTAGRVPFAGTAGLLSDDSDLTFSGDTLTATKISATQITATGDISTSGSIFAREFHTEFTSASVTFASGSNKFGDDSGDTHRVTGSLLVSGSITMAHGDLTVTDNLDIEGDVDINGTTNLDNTDIDGTLTVDGGNIVFNEDSADQDFRVESNGNANMFFVDGGANAVGIGIGAPINESSGVLLHIADTGNSNAAHINLSGGDGAAGSQTGKITFSDPGDPDDGVAFISSNIEGGGANPGGNLNFFTSTDGGGSDNSVALRMTISGSGNVGIGTNNPATKLHIGDGTAGDYIETRIQGGSDNGKGAVLRFMRGSNTSFFVGDVAALQGGSESSSDGAIYAFTSNGIRFYTNGNNERMRILSGGNVGIGTNNPGEKLHVYGGAGTTIKVESTAGNDAKMDYQTTTTKYRLGVNIGGVGNDTFSILDMEAGGGTERLRIKSDGEIDGNFNDTSDRAQKENIKDLTNTLEGVKALNPSTFNWIEDKYKTDKLRIGFIAQDVEAQFPELVDGKEGEKSISTIGLVSVLTKTVQELIKRIEELENK